MLQGAILLRAGVICPRFINFTTETLKEQPVTTSIKILLGEQAIIYYKLGLFVNARVGRGDKNDSQKGAKMRKYGVKSARVWLMAGAMLACSASSWADSLTGKVVGVADGDTITVLDSSNTQHKIRLAGIDAPEKAQPFGEQSKLNLSRMVFGRQVIIDWQKRDRYQRIVGKVLLDHRDVNLEQVKTGLAWHYKKYATEQSADDQESYARTELNAQQAKAGLWVEANPVAPWNWRKQKRDERHG